MNRKGHTFWAKYHQLNAAIYHKEGRHVEAAWQYHRARLHLWALLGYEVTL